jgi:Tol biopolymer transport system component
LKPGNIMLTKTGAKLLDFGLAKQGGTHAPPRVDEGAQGTAVPGTRSAESLTEEGMILGTLEYMAPEQVQGKQADARTDIFALGVVLYEMVTGKKAFEGESKASLMAAILTSQPAPVTTIQPLTPPLEQLVARCLAKHPDDRIQTAHDAELLLRWIAEEHRSPAVTGARQAPAGVKRPRFIIAATIVALALAFAYLYHVWPQRLQARAFVLPPENAAFNLLGDNAAPPVLSPDGSAVVFGAGDQLWLRPLEELSPRPLSDTQGARFPFWSPDSKSLGFFAEGKLKVMEIATGAPIAIADVSEARGGSWSSDGTIIFEPHWGGPLYSIPATGGVPVAITKIDQTRHTTHRWPHFLPDGKHFLYLALNHNRPRDPQNTVFIASVDGKVNRPLLRLSSNAQFTAGYVFYIRDNTLLAQRLNQRTFQLEGKPVPIASGVVDDITWHGGFTVSSAGTLAYVPVSGRPVAQMTWMDRSGKELGVVGEPADIHSLRLSPDGQRVAFNIDQDIYVVDIAGGTPAKLTFNHGVNGSPTWSPDGRWIAYAISWPDSSETRVVRKSSNGTGTEEILYSSKDDLLYPTDWSPEGFLLLSHFLPAGIEVLPLEGERKPYKAVTSSPDALGGTLSPDGHWLAYASRESGRFEIYVVPFPGPGSERQVSPNGAWTPARWSRDGKELYYADSSMAGHATAIRPSGNELTILDTRPILPGVKDVVGIDVARDGRFLVARGSRTRPPSAIVLVTNWRAQVEE